MWSGYGVMIITNIIFIMILIMKSNMYIMFQALILQHAYAWLGMGSDHEGDLDSGSLYMYMSLLVVQLACQIAN